jgi:hypothetical protein
LEPEAAVVGEVAFWGAVDEVVPPLEPGATPGEDDPDVVVVTEGLPGEDDGAVSGVDGGGEGGGEGGQMAL